MANDTEPTVKAIETEYAGHVFRSRLEARWAVFFDHAGIHWEYEPEGFETTEGRYLPDFRIYLRTPDSPMLFEIKPISKIEIGEDCVHPEIDRRWMQVAAAVPEQPFLVACGIPSGHRVSDWVEQTGGIHRIYGDGSHWFPYIFTTCPCCEGVGIGSAKKPLPPLIHAAFNAATSARFEYGAKGTVK